MKFKNSLVSEKLFQNIPTVDSYKTRKLWEYAVWEIVLKRFDDTTAVALPLITSADERRMIVYRIAAISRLQMGIGPSEISRELWLSRQTISAIKKGLIENQYQSSRSRGHKKKVYSDDNNLISDQKEHHRYRRTKYGKVKLH